MRGRVCLLYMLLVLKSAVFLGSESLGTRDHILLSQIEDFPFRHLLQLSGSRCKYSTPPPHGLLTNYSESESNVTTDGQSASLSWYKAPIRGLRPDFYFRTEYGIRLTVIFLIPWGALSDERTGLSFVCAAGPCQLSLSRVLAPWNLRPYSTVSDLRLPFSSPPTTRRVTMKVFDPASTRATVSLRPPDSHCRDPPLKADISGPKIAHLVSRFILHRNELVS
jgi:hypothetical protein